MRRRLSVHAWSRLGRRVRVVPAPRTTEQDEAAWAQEANRTARREGTCQYCGVDVNENVGVLHAADCSVDVSRRRAS